MEIIMIGKRIETDKYGHKAMLEKLNKIGRCPRCESFYIKNETGDIVCPKNCENITSKELKDWNKKWSKWSKND